MGINKAKRKVPCHHNSIPRPLTHSRLSDSQLTIFLINHPFNCLIIHPHFFVIISFIKRQNDEMKSASWSKLIPANCASQHPSMLLWPIILNTVYWRLLLSESTKVQMASFTFSAFVDPSLPSASLNFHISNLSIFLSTKTTGPRTARSGVQTTATSSSRWRVTTPSPLSSTRPKWRTQATTSLPSATSRVPAPQRATLLSRVSTTVFIK